MRAPDRRQAGLADAEMLDLALTHEIGHRADCVLYRDIGIDPVDEIEVDEFGLETLQALVAAFLDVFGAAIGEARPALKLHIAEFAGDHVIAAMPGDGARDQLLVAPEAVGVGSVEKIDAELARPADRRDRGVRIRRVVERRHRAAAKPDRRDLPTAPPAPLHIALLNRRGATV